MKIPQKYLLQRLFLAKYFQIIGGITNNIKEIYKTMHNSVNNLLIQSIL